MVAMYISPNGVQWEWRRGVTRHHLTNTGNNWTLCDGSRGLITGTATTPPAERQCKRCKNYLDGRLLPVDDPRVPDIRAEFERIHAGAE